MKLHILGIGGTFMGGLALIAREAGHRVSGTDAAVYPPMSTQLQEQGITVYEGYDPDHLERDLDCVVIGNALSRGNPMVEHVLYLGVPYTSGPRWLAENVLGSKRVIAVAGTHGKTTTASLLAWMLEHTGKKPGFLIGGVPGNFRVSARLADGDCFVIEADEYDTAFFDKRAKFMHYAPEVAVLNNLEFDHADIYPDLTAIQRQFHHLLRIVPGNGQIICNARDKALREVLDMGCWTPVQWFDPHVDAGPNSGLGSGGLDTDWSISDAQADGSRWTVKHGEKIAQVRWQLNGLHNVANGLAAIAGAGACDVELEAAAEALAEFRGVRRRLEVLTRAGDVTVYDDFAHHPTEIRATLNGLRAKVGDARIVAAFEPRSNSMRLGVHADMLAGSLADADRVLILGREDLRWDPADLSQSLGSRAAVVVSHVDELVDRLSDEVRSGDHVIFLSNGSFDGAPARFVAALEARESANTG